jgi:hypothetical protein
VLGQVEAPAGASVETLAGANVTPAATETSKRRPPTKRKRKPTKARRKTATKKAPVVLPAGEAGEHPASVAAPDGEEGPKRGKRQALGMSFSKLRAAIQARRTGQRESHESAPAEHSG